MQYDYLVMLIKGGVFIPMFAIEYQGEQHSMPLYGDDKFKSQRQRDIRKQRLSDKMKIPILYFYHTEKLNYVTFMKKMHSRRLLRKFLHGDLIKKNYRKIANDIIARRIVRT